MMSKCGVGESGVFKKTTRHQKYVSIVHVLKNSIVLM
jgi:hypothetical protein